MMVPTQAIWSDSIMAETELSRKPQSGPPSKNILESIVASAARQRRGCPQQSTSTLTGGPQEQATAPGEPEVALGRRGAVADAAVVAMHAAHTSLRRSAMETSSMTKTMTNSSMMMTETLLHWKKLVLREEQVADATARRRRR